jgi:hypothetical protein
LLKDVDTNAFDSESDGIYKKMADPHRLHNQSRNMKIQILLGIAVLAVTSAVADNQASLIAELRANPTEDFAGKNLGDLMALAEADAMVFAQDHKTSGGGQVLNIGTAHAFKHHLMGEEASMYMIYFSNALNALSTNSD